MPTPIIINGKEEILPGVYSTIKSGIKNPAQDTSYGKVCIIDRGTGAGWAGGCGIMGSQSSGLDSVYSFTSIDDFRTLARGGFYYGISEYLFKPLGIGNRDINGASTVYYIKAAETTQASLVLNFTIGNFLIKTKDEGTACNGESTSGVLTKGYGAKLMQSPTSSGLYYVSFMIGNYRGIDPLNNTPWDDVELANVKESVIFNSPEFSNIKDLKTWMTKNANFKKVFSLESSPADNVVNATITNTDITNLSTLKLFSGATEVFSISAYDRVFEILNQVDNNFFLAPDFGDNAQSANNVKLFYHITNQSKYDKFMFVGGGYDQDEFQTNSIETAQFYNSDKVVVVHGGYWDITKLSPDLKKFNQLSKASLVMSRIAGVRPENSGTFKKLSIKGEIHPLSDKEQKSCLTNGVMYTFKDDTLGFVLGQAITSIQDNDFLVNEDASTFSLQLSRIKAFLNKELMVKFKKDFYGREEGVNRSNASESDITTWMNAFLQSKIREGVIIDFRNIVVSYSQDNAYVNYEFIPAFEINKFIITGTILEK